MRIYKLIQLYYLLIYLHMRNNLFILSFLFFIFWNSAYAGSWSSTTGSWINNSGIITSECGTSTDTSSNFVGTLSGIPNINTDSTSTDSTYWVSCTTHAYYPSSAYTLAYSSSTSWVGITECNYWDKVVSIDTTNSTITCQKYDDKAPLESDFVASSLYLEATDSYDFSNIIDVQSWSPIVSASIELENYDITWTPITHDFLSADIVDSTLELVWDIRDVDSDRWSDNNTAREYTFTVDSLCDEAWNCLENPFDVDYNVYASTNSEGTFVLDSNDKNSFTSWTYSADWLVKPFDIALKDKWWNYIVPAPTIWRTIDFDFNITNTTELDQYALSWESAVWVISEWLYSDIAEWTNDISFDSKTVKSDSTYGFDFKFYNSTNLWDSLSYGDFAINSLTFDATTAYSLSNFNSIVSKPLDNIDNTNWFKFAVWPLYSATFTWSQANDWLIVWANQYWEIDLDLNWSDSEVAGDTDLYLEYWYYDDDASLSNSEKHKVQPNLTMDYYDSSWKTLIWWYQPLLSSLTKYVTAVNQNEYDITTQLTQSGSLSEKEQNTYLSSHLSYNLDWKDVVYNSDVLWLDAYWNGFNLNNNTYQKGIFIDWITHTDKQNETITWEEWDSYTLLWNIEKAWTQSIIRKNAYSATKYSPINNWGKEIKKIDDISSSFNDWTRIWDNILYFWELGWDIVTLNDPDSYTWNKTIVVVWGNLYIESNIIADDKESDILWIIVLKDEEGNGGNIYIDPVVENIDSILYADKAMVSYDPTYGEISPDTWFDYNNLNNQLIIYWTLFSNNTIWGSVDSPYLCPFYISDGDCDLDTAQKYDLNYIRRGYTNLYKSSWDTYYLDGTDASVPIKEQYPVIINYNSLIQINPPVLFSE